MTPELWQRIKNYLNKENLRVRGIILFSYDALSDVCRFELYSFGDFISCIGSFSTLEDLSAFLEKQGY